MDSGVQTSLQLPGGLGCCRPDTKDPYDLFCILRNFPDGSKGVADRLRPLIGEPHVSEALQVLKEDFAVHDGVGSMRVAQFLTRSSNDEVQADVVGYVIRLLELVG